MKELRDTVTLDVPPAQAETCILRYFDRHRTANGDIEIPLQAMNLSHTVTVHVRKERDAQNLNDEIAMRWEPGADEPFPSFAGSMIVWSESPGTSLIELRGTYEPPLGKAGKLFDDAVGHMIAKQTAHQFLLTLAEGAKACFHQ